MDQQIKLGAPAVAGPETGRPRHRGPLALAFAASVAVSGGASLLYPVLPVLAGDLGVEQARIGLVVAAFTAPAVVLAPLFGMMADLHGRRWILIFGLALFGLAGSAAGLAPSYSWLLALRALQGVGMSALSPLTIVLISDLVPENREIRSQGHKVVIDRVAMILLPILGGVLAGISWRLAFAPFILTIPLAIAAFLWMPETNHSGSDTIGSYLRRTLRVIREPRFAVAFGTGFLRFFLDYGLYTYLPLLLALRYGAAPTVAGWLIALSAAGSIVTAMSIGHIHGHWSAERFLVVAFLASALGLAIVALDQPLWLIGVAVFVFGLGNGLISPLQKSLLTRRTHPGLRGGVISVDRMIQQIAKSLAPTLMGLLLVVADLEAVFWTLCGLSLLGMFALLWKDATAPVERNI
jgi:MFS transporter, ACDE family, multidrug resistance protein